MNDPANAFGASFDPTRRDAGPQASTPGQALQVIGLHIPKFAGRGIPDQLTGASSHVGQSPEALVLASLLKASQSAGTMGTGVTPQSGPMDLLKFIQDHLTGAGSAGAPPSMTPPPPVAPVANQAPHVTPITPVPNGPGLANGLGRNNGFTAPTPMNPGGPIFGRG